MKVYVLIAYFTGEYLGVFRTKLEADRMQVEFSRTGDSESCYVKEEDISDG